MKYTTLGGGLALLLLLAPSGAWAKDFYIDPVKGSDAGDGSEASPWKTLEAVVEGKKIETQHWESLPYAEGKKLVVKNAGAPVKGGDTLWLRDGYHGRPLFQGYYNAQELTIAAAPGHQPRLAELRVQAGQNFRFVGLQISPDHAPAFDKHTLVAIGNHSFHGPVSDVTMEGCNLVGKLDPSSWTKQDWDQLSPNGISAGGKNITLRNNTIKNINFAIAVSASDSLVEGNLIDSFSGDGMRGLGDNTVFQYNTVKNLIYVNDNHPDGFQSWSVGADGKVGTGEVKGIVLRGNTFINFTDPAQPFRGNLQGIGCFDGMFVDWIVENNVVITDHWHGISLYGARNARIVNNTVIGIDSAEIGPPWITIKDHKNGTKPEDCVVRNNLATSFQLPKEGVVADHNLTVKDPGAFFVNKGAFDVRLLPGSEAIDAGSSDLAPSLDLLKIPRPQGPAIDLGAHEWHDGSVGAAGAGGAGGAGGAAGAGGAGGQAGVGGSGTSGQAGAGFGGAPGGTGGGAGSGGAGSGGAGAGGAGSGGAGGAELGGAGPSGSGGSGQSGTGGSGQKGGVGGEGAGPEGSGVNPGAEGEESGCGCRLVHPEGSAGALLGAMALAALAVRRKRSI
ncbi:MAG: right-handed parallel beta-helix repeat-containing protein [Polyangiaceae bacterium]|nr:right-handed parallel beta-helix repeat-containing protein [Polyangiaceae bacterium]